MYGNPYSKFAKCKRGKAYKTIYNLISIYSFRLFMYKRIWRRATQGSIYTKTTYARKAKFIEAVLQEMNIGELSADMNKFIHVLKHTCHRQIRSVIRGLRDMIDRKEGYPTKIVYTLKNYCIKHLNIKSLMLQRKKVSTLLLRNIYQKREIVTVSKLSLISVYIILCTLFTTLRRCLRMCIHY